MSTLAGRSRLPGDNDYSPKVIFTVSTVYVVGGHPMLAAAAELAVVKWRYQPASKDTLFTVPSALTIN
jgi:hypothetical protein